MKNNAVRAGHAAAFVTILIWGTTFVSTKVLLELFTPLEILWIRFVIGYLALWCVCPRRLRLKGGRQEGYFAAAGFCGVTLYYLLENMALTYTLASNVGVMISIAPFFTAIFTGLFLHEQRPSPCFFLGFAIAMAGILIISFGAETVLQVNPLGDALAVLAAAVWAAYSTLAKKISTFDAQTLQITRRTFFYGLLFMTPAMFWMDFHLVPALLWTPKALGNLLFLGLGASAFCFVTWNFAVKALGSVKTSVYIYMVPVITAAASALILREPLTWFVIGGIGLTLVGLFLSEQGKTKQEGEKSWRLKIKNAFW